MALESVGLLSIYAAIEGASPMVQVHPLTAETMWRKVHVAGKLGCRTRKYTQYVARTASNGAVVASMIIEGVDDSGSSDSWRLMYPHLMELLNFEADYLNKQERAELIRAAWRGIGPLITNGRLAEVEDLSSVMFDRARIWGDDPMFALACMNLSNADRFTLHDIQNALDLT
jgi:hypothetical protein